jgi:hypothetical protein
MTPGIYTMDAATYHADPCDAPSLSSSIAKLLCASSPAHARHAHPRLTPEAVAVTGDQVDLGTAAHAILLEGVNCVAVLDYPDWRTKAAQTARAAVRAMGKVPLLAKAWGDLEAMLNATRDQLDAHVDGQHMFRGGLAEQTLIWQDDGGEWCRARLDWLRPGAIDDYKTTSATANPEVLSRTLYTHGWDVQAAFYLRGLKRLTGEDAVFRFCVQETFAPYALSVVALGPAALMLAEKKIRYARELWTQCLEHGDWPGYPTQTAYAELPPYLEAAWLQKEEASIV